MIENEHTGKAPKIRGIIFDMDGTLLDSIPAWTQATQIFLQGKVREIPPDYEDAMYDMSLPETFAYLKEIFHLPMSAEQVGREIYAEVIKLYAEKVPIKPGVREMLADLKERNIPCCVATLSTGELARVALTRLGIYDQFRCVLSSEGTGLSKHDPGLFHLAAQKMGLPPEELMVIDDSLYAVKSAVQGGYTTVAVYDAYSWQWWEDLQSCAQFSLKGLEEWPVLRDALIASQRL